MGAAPTSKGTVTEYRLSMHFGVCHGPVDAITRLTIGEKIAWSGSIYEGQLNFGDRNLFGGVEKEGGIEGAVIVLSGKDTQVLPEFLANKLGGTATTVPGFRGLLSVFFREYDGQSRKGFYWSANSPYLKSPSFRVRRSPKGFYPERSMIGDDANPSHIIYECLTNNVWGMGGSTDQLDVNSFVAAADTLYNENFGMSLMWTGQTTIESFAQEILDHIEATFFLHPRTGLFTLKLIRQDFDPATLYEINESNSELLNFQRKGWGETTNEINASWTNPENEQEENVTVHSLGNIAAQGSIVSDGRNYYGVRNAQLALRMATRDLNAASYPIASVDVAVDRSAWSRVPGEVVAVTWPEHGLFRLPMRVGPIDYGRPKSPRIKINLVEDVFAIPATSYVDTPGSQWTDPTNPPTPLAYYTFLNAPYYMLSRIVGDDAAAALAYPQQYVIALTAQNTLDTSSVDMLSEVVTNVGTTEIERVATLSLAGRGTVSTALAKAARTALPALGSAFGNTGAEVGTLVLIGSDAETHAELAVIESVSGGVGQLRRGALDTVPRAWPAGTPVWFFRPSASIYDPQAHAAGETVPYKLLPRTSGGLLDESLAPDLTFTVTDRLHRPLRPANVSINGTLFGPTTMTTAAMTGFTVNWSDRNRLFETSQILSWDDAGVTPEVGQTATVQVRKADGTVLETVTGITTQTFTSTFSPASVDPAGIIVEVWSVRDGIESLQRFRADIQKV